jgi:hypothetical protein
MPLAASSKPEPGGKASQCSAVHCPSTPLGAWSRSLSGFAGQKFAQADGLNEFLKPICYFSCQFKKILVSPQENSQTTGCQGLRRQHYSAFFPELLPQVTPVT